MKRKLKQSGFSLTEVLMAAGILTVGLMLVATMFPVGIYLTTKSSERAVAAVVADEAFAKIHFYGIDTAEVEPNSCKDYNDVVLSTDMNPDEYLYPSLDGDSGSCQYSWSALCKLADVNDNDNLVLVTVFVSRKTNAGLKYEDSVDGSEIDWPIPIKVGFTSVSNYEMTINSVQKKYVNSSAIIVDDSSGQLYTVVKKADNGVITVDRKITSVGSGDIWVVPPPKSGGRAAGIEAYQRIMKF